MNDPVTSDAWAALRAWTTARVALGRAGTSLPTAPMLEFQWAHARARDAIARPCTFAGLADRAASWGLTTISVHSQATSREEYLRRPDLGRRLDSTCEATLLAHARQGGLSLIVGDGLSSWAVDRQAGPLLDELIPRLREAGWHLTPLVLASQARVALSDEIGAALGADLVIVLIGERPGLSAPDSLGAYLTWGPRRGRQNAERNCVSNIRPEGLSFGAAAQTLVSLSLGARQLGQSGIRLKEDSWIPNQG